MCFKWQNWLSYQLKLAFEATWSCFYVKMFWNAPLTEPHHEKTCFCLMRTTKVQIIQRTRAVWSAPLLFNPYFCGCKWWMLSFLTPAHGRVFCGWPGRKPRRQVFTWWVSTRILKYFFWWKLENLFNNKLFAKSVGTCRQITFTSSPLPLPPTDILWYKKTNKPLHDKTNKMACVPSENSDQPGHLPILINVFTVHM